MTRVILVRHGETTWNREGRYQGQIDTPLSPFGIRQGEAVAAALRDLPLDAVYSSPLSRSYDTAMMCARYHDLSVTKEPRLTEINHGEWEGMLAEEVRLRDAERLAEWHRDVTQVRMPGGETVEEVRQRAMDALRDIALQHDGQTVLIVAHDAVNKVILCSILDIPLDHFWQIKQDNTCINVFEYDKGSYRMVLMNSTLHLGFLYSGIEQQGL